MLDLPVDSFWQDIRHGARALRQSPTFTVVVALTLGLGIGANTAIFSVVNSLLLRPLPVREPDNLVVLAVSHEGNQEPHPPSYLDYLDYQNQARSVSAIAGYLIGFVGLSADRRADRIGACYVTPNYFQMLGIQASLGRVILPSEGLKPGADPVLVLSDDFWRRRFAADPRVIGKVVRINGRPFTIVGVTPPGFRGTYAILSVDAFLPLGMASESAEYRESLTQRDSHDLRLLARLQPGVGLDAARTEFDLIGKRLARQYPDTNKTVAVHVFPEHLARPEPNAAGANPVVATIFMALTGMVLLVACVNVANLLLVRATLRSKESAIRAAIGARPLRLIRQFLTESLLLALLGAGAGIAVGRWVSGLLASIRLPGDMPIHFDFDFDWRVFGYVAGIALFTGIAVGLVPALRAARVDLNHALREGGRGAAAGGGRHRFRNLLVIAQVAGSMLLLIAAGLFIRSLSNAQSVDLGFEPKGLLNLSIDPAQQGYDEIRGTEFYRQIEERVRALPGVESVSFAHSVPMGYYSLAEYINLEGQRLQGPQRPIAGYNLVGPDYFASLKIPILLGRGLSRDDHAGARPVAVVNQLMAEKLWPQRDPIGARFSFSGPEGPYVEVVGVSKNGKYGWLFEDPGMYFFVPLAQKYVSLRALHVRTRLPPQTLALSIQQQIRALEPDLPVHDVMTMEQALQGGNGFFLIRMGALLAAALGLLGLVLAVVGVYGVVSYSASQRTHEIGIRMALGAEASDILRLVVGQGLILVAAGAALGLIAALILSRFVANFLFGISPQDPMTFAGVAALLGAVALVACWLPARRATRVDPLVALRYE